MDTSKHIGSNLYLYTDQTDIIDYLVDHKLMPNSISKAFVRTNLLGKDFDLILFDSKQEVNRFMHFKFIDFAADSDSLVYLNSVYTQLALVDYDTYKPVQKKLEEMLHMLPTFRALFNYRYNEDSNHFEYLKF
jgi:hypothetical protein